MKTIYDRVCPSSYYSVKEVAKYEKLSEIRADELVRMTVQNVTTLCRKEGVPYGKVAARWNDIGLGENGEPCGWKFDKTVNALFWHTKLEPIAALFRIYMVRRMGYGGSAGDVWMCDFGILKSHYERYRKTGKVYGAAQVRRNTKYQGLTARENRTRLHLGDKGVEVPKNAQYERFRAGCERWSRMDGTKHSMTETAMAALREYMDAREDVFGTVDGFLPKKQRRTRKAADKTTVTLESGTVHRLDEFVQRWNGAARAPITKSLVMENALNAYLDAMPHEFSDPEMWEAEGLQTGATRERSERGG